MLGWMGRALTLEIKPLCGNRLREACPDSWHKVMATGASLLSSAAPSGNTEIILFAVGAWVLVQVEGVFRFPFFTLPP